MRILLAGDCHGNVNHIQYLFQQAFDFDCDRIFQLGDYGYWEHKKGGPEFLQVTSEFATLNNIPFYWLDGNHENHAWLRMKRDKWTKLLYDGKHAPEQPYSENLNDEGFWEIRPNLYYAPRGHRFQWDGVNFMAFGGAFSIDRAWRRIAESWWWEEEITTDEVVAAIDGPKIDVLLSHDLPSGVDMRAMMAKRGYNYQNIPASEMGRAHLRTVVQALQPNLVYHGHYHINYVEYIDYGTVDRKLVRVQGLDCDDSGNNSWTILDTKDINGLKD